jgi:hypothetical protein
MIYYHVISLLITNALLILWFYSPLSNTIGKIFLKRNDIYVLDNLIDTISLKSDYLGMLLSCWICLSFWLSLIVGSILMAIFTLPLEFPILCFFCNPPILFIIKQLYR